MTERIALNIDDRKLPGFITAQTFQVTFYLHHIHMNASMTKLYICICNVNVIEPFIPAGL